MATKRKTEITFKDFTFKRASDIGSLPTNWTPGVVTDSFQLSVQSPTLKNKGNVYAWRPLYWDEMYNIVDFDNLNDSSLYFNIANVRNKAVVLTFNLTVLNYSHKTGNGKLAVTFNHYSSNQQMKSITLPHGTAIFTQFTVRCNKIVDNDNITVKISSSDFEDWAFRDVKVDLFDPYF